ncbi:SidE phosphodiesterase domain-containing protein [Legionella sp. 16cNR16C]|uniref:SidE phosphodiesterase domain-containing protein n=1 Tax=Legionella sp. 16cNR16C TaxID=2905656 RepID=UPI001E2C0861|nr:SidE phosphodiesterase domain-containing protein [Legionella sp. 16cNR16C]MCE3044228.1 SidE phosphodiesterase domain-containing protein [Legionella sp. 16cNR16C]
MAIPDFSSPIAEIANFIGQEVYKKAFPTHKKVNTPFGQVLDRTTTVTPNTPRAIHGFDNANRAAALIPHIIDLMKRNMESLPTDWRHQLVELNDETVKALQIAALMRASGRHFLPGTTEKFQNNPDYGNGTNYAEYGETECIAMLKKLNIPSSIDSATIAHAIVGNEYVGAHNANSQVEKIKAEHQTSKNDIFSLILNVANVLETTRDRSKKTVDLNWTPIFREISRNPQGKADCMDFARRHIQLIRQQQGFLMTTVTMDKEIIAKGTDNPNHYNGQSIQDAHEMFDAVNETHYLHSIETEEEKQFEKSTPQTAVIPKNPVITIDPVEVRELKQFYKYAVAQQNEGRSNHKFEAQSENYQGAKGDFLKTIILIKLKKILEKCENIDAFESKLNEIKRGEDLKILKTSQGSFYSFFNIKTTSLTAFEKIERTLRENFENQAKSTASVDKSL